MTITSDGLQTKATPLPMTLEEYLNYDDGTETRYELVDGVLVEMGAKSKLNVQIAMFLAFQLGMVGVPHYLLTNKAEIVVSSRRLTTCYPDLVVLTEELEALLDDSYRYIIKSDMPAPALVVEVVSPGDEESDNYRRDYIEKRQEYAARGIPEYWIVDPNTIPTVTLTAEQILTAGK